METFVPVWRTQHKLRAGLVDMELPVFPSYVFCRMNLHNRLPVLMVPGVQRIAGAGRTPLPIPAVEIERIAAVGRSPLRFRPCDYLRSGDEVTLAEGPLAGLQGRVIRTAGDTRLVVGITLLHRALAVEIDPSWIALPNPRWLPPVAFSANQSKVQQ
jgi:transcription antitermination factor NusG